MKRIIICGAPSKSVSSSIPSWQILTAHARPFRGARDLAFCLKVSLDSLLVWASSGGSGETARMRRLPWTFAACIGDKYQIRLTRPISLSSITHLCFSTLFESLKLLKGQFDTNWQIYNDGLVNAIISCLFTHTVSSIFWRNFSWGRGWVPIKPV